MLPETYPYWIFGLEAKINKEIVTRWLQLVITTVFARKILQRDIFLVTYSFFQPTRRLFD